MNFSKNQLEVYLIKKQGQNYESAHKVYTKLTSILEESRNNKPTACSSIHLMIKKKILDFCDNLSSQLLQTPSPNI